MKRIVLFSLVLGTSLAYGEGSDLLVGKDGDKKFVPIVKTVKKLIFDDPFVVQAYGSLRALGVSDEKTISAFDYLFEKDYEKALGLISQISPSNKTQQLISATKIYLFYKMKFSQNTVNLWIKESVENNLNNTQLGVSLDQIIGEKSSRWILKNGIYLSPQQLVQIGKISNDESRFNYSLQAYSLLRSGMEGFKYLGKLGTHDPLRFKLANTVVIAFAKENKLAQAGKIVKEIIEPVIDKSENTEKISKYYLTLGRLLYQAGAYKASKQYYKSIPDSSSEFLKSRVESLWVSMVANDHSVILGELKSLELQAFEKEFLPELYLVSAMANLQLCQFSAVEKSFKKFIMTNKKYLKQNDFVASNEHEYLKRLRKFNKKSHKVLKKLKSLGLKTEISEIESLVQSAKDSIQTEIKIVELGKKKLIEQALRNMRFVKVEYLSTMRRLSGKLASNNFEDQVSVMTSAIDKSDKLEFPYDGVLFGDELFHMRSKIKSLCLKEKK